MSCVWGCMCVMFVNDHPGKLAPSLALYPRLLYGSTHVAFHRALVQVTDVEGAGLFFFLLDWHDTVCSYGVYMHSGGKAQEATRTDGRTCGRRTESRPRRAPAARDRAGRCMIAGLSRLAGR